MSKVVIHLEGGIVQSVTSNVPVEYVLIDYDTEGLEEDRTTDIPQDNGVLVPAYAYHAKADVMPKRVRQLFAAVELANE